MNTCKTCMKWAGPYDSKLAHCCHQKLSWLSNGMLDSAPSDQCAPYSVMDSNEIMPGGIYPAHILTGPDFGCVHHVAKSDA